MKFIAEIGMNHNGNFSLAYELMRQAKLAGADIVKFQLGWRSKPEEINNITTEILAQLKRWSDYLEIELMFSIITNEAYELVKQINPHKYKIASRTVVDNPSLVERIINENKPTIISLGMWKGPGLPWEGRKNVSYLWCLSKYPCEPWDLVGLPKVFDGNPYKGYSDHTIGIDTALLAISRGASIIEKHFTLDKSDTTIRDHALSATPEEFLQMTIWGREMHRKLKLGV